VFTLYTLICTKLTIWLCIVGNIVNIIFISRGCKFEDTNENHISIDNYISLVYEIICDMSFFMVCTMQVFEWVCMIHVILYEKSRKCEEIWFDLQNPNINSKGGLNSLKRREILMKVLFKVSTLVVLAVYMIGIVQTYTEIRYTYLGLWFKSIYLAVFSLTFLVLMFLLRFNHRYEYDLNKKWMILFFLLCFSLIAL
jgi:hypothetical protein